MWIQNCLRVASRFINTCFLFGYPTETVSGRCYEEEILIGIAILDTIFGEDHCFTQWQIDRGHLDSRIYEK